MLLATVKVWPAQPGLGEGCKLVSATNDFPQAILPGYGLTPRILASEQQASAQQEGRTPLTTRDEEISNYVHRIGGYPHVDLPEALLQYSLEVLKVGPVFGQIRHVHEKPSEIVLERSALLLPYP